MPRRPSPTDHLDKVRDKMGTIPDHEVADLCGSTAAIVGRYRRKHGIKAYQGYKFVKGTKPPGSTSGDKPRRARKSKLDPFREEVGKIPDKVVAEKAGVSVEGVRMYRKRHCIALEPSARQPRGRKAKTAKPAVSADVEAAAVEAAAAVDEQPAAPKRRKRRSKLDPFRDELGVRPDRELAEKAGVSLQAVRQYRRRHNIDAPPKGGAAPAAPAPAPAAASGESWGYSVTVQADGAEKTWFLIADNIISAASRVTDGRVVAIKQLGPALV